MNYYTFAVKNLGPHIHKSCGFFVAYCLPSNPVLVTSTFRTLFSERSVMKKVAIYARVSTDKQTCENQLKELRAVAERMGYTIVQEFIDEGISGIKASRPTQDLMMKMATQRKFDMVMCWSIDRLGRSLQNLIELLNQLESVRIDLFFHQQAIDTSTPMGKMMFSILGALGAYERELIRERVIAGLQTAKSRGVKLGRPSKMNEGMKNAVQLLRSNGMGIKQIAKQLQIGVGTVYSAI